MKRYEVVRTCRRKRRLTMKHLILIEAVADSYENKSIYFKTTKNLKSLKRGKLVFT